MPFLKTETANKGIDFAKAMPLVEREYGVSRYKQLREIARLAAAGPRFAPNEYYTLGAFSPEVPFQEKMEFFSKRRSIRINRAMSPADLGAMPLLMRDKLASGVLLSEYGFPVPKHVGAYAPDGRYGGAARMRNAQEIAMFLKNNDRWPLFGKPNVSSFAIGAASYLGTEGEDLIIGNQSRVPLDAFARDIIDLFPQGYVFQEFAWQHQDAEAIAGGAVGVVRLVTLRTEDGIGLYYALWRLPGRGAMSDGAQPNAGPTGRAEINPETGEIRSAHFGDRLFGADARVSPVTGAQLVGAKVPFFREAVSMTVDAHEVFPTHGLVGWDIIIGREGPMIGEANPNPGHFLLHDATGRAIQSRAKKELARAALEFAQKRRADSRKKGVIRFWEI